MSRPMLLAYEGWYPENMDDCKKEISKYIDTEYKTEKHTLISGITPHAGWRFCGNLAINTIRLLAEKNQDIETIFIFGGHLPGYASPILETFTNAQTPLGYLEADSEVIDFIGKDQSIQKQEFVRDNSVEVLLPIIKYFFGNVKIVCLYIPPNKKIFRILDRVYENFGKKSIFIGSTDLTHYGTNYNFTKNTGELSAIDWVKNVNDNKYISLLLQLDHENSMDYALKNSAACSSGAAAAAVYMAKKAGILTSELLGHTTSYDIIKSTSFVGYAGIIF